MKVAVPDAEVPAHAGDAESRGWTVLAVDCEPKRRALASLSALPTLEPLPRVTYHSKGNALVVGADERAVSAAIALAATLPVTLLLTSRPSAQAALLGGVQLGDAAFPIWGGKIATLRGYLGNFTATLADLTVVRDAGERSVPGAAGAVFDLVIDFSDPPLFGHHQPPQGYWRVSDPASLDLALAEAPSAVGEFEKPRYFSYRESLCAHARSRLGACRALITGSS